MTKNKQQSAMEYLMTYGWSILIIAIVLAVLYSLGVFGNSSLGPRAQPNSCRVFRPNGPGTTTNINLEGVCNGELPEYVGQFNGQNTNIVAGTTGFPTGSNARSIFMWAYFYPPGTGYDEAFSYGQNAANKALALAYHGGTLLIDDSSTGYYQSTLPVSLGSWHFIGLVYSAGSTSITAYVDGVSQSGGLNDGIALNTQLVSSDIGSFLGADEFNGLAADVQVYNTTLDSAAVNALYQEGIGGAPIEPQYLVAWWPLNGDANDYSGNGNNGVPTSLTFTSSWTTGYTTP